MILNNFKIYRYLSLFAGIFLLLIIFHTGSVHAIQGDCFFTNKDGPVNGTGNCEAAGNYGVYGKNDVLTGRDSNGNGSAIPGNVNTRPEFINFITDRFNSKNVQDRVGAAFIIQEMRPKQDKDRTWPSNADVNNWKDLMNQPGVEVLRKKDFSVDRTSYYDPGKHNVFYAPHPTATRTVIYVKYKGKIIAEIETECGNNVSGFPGFPDEWDISATSTVSTNVITLVKDAPKPSVTFTHHIWNSGKGNTNGDIIRNHNLAPTNINPGQNLSQYLGNAMDLPNGTGRGNGNNRTVSATYSLDTQVSKKYCEHIHYTPANQGGGKGDSTEACVMVNVIDPTVKTTTVDYEKGSLNSGVFEVKHTLDIGIPHGSNTCLNINNVNWTIKGKKGNGEDYNENIVTNFVNGVKCTQTEIRSINVSWLNNNDPETVLDAYQTTAFGKTANGTLIIYEVPYARFYGSDVYANISPYFNSKGSGLNFSSPFDTGVGSVAQFAVMMAANTSDPTRDIKLPSAGFRASPLTPFRADGLKAKVSPVSTPTLTCRSSSTVTSASDLLSNSGCYDVGNDNLTLNGPSYGQKQITIISKGTVTINNDITNNGPSPDNVPVLVIKAKNINIVGSVNRIDAILIATDTIDTCSGISADKRYTSCRKTLTVNGALSANIIKFQRSVGTRLLGAENENGNDAGKQNISSRDKGNNATAAEIVNFPAYLYFATPADGTNSRNGLGLKSYLNAPPRL